MINIEDLVCMSPICKALCVKLLKRCTKNYQSQRRGSQGISNRRHKINNSSRREGRDSTLRKNQTHKQQKVDHNPLYVYQDPRRETNFPARFCCWSCQATKVHNQCYGNDCLKNKCHGSINWLSNCCRATEWKECYVQNGLGKEDDIDYSGLQHQRCPCWGW